MTVVILCFATLVESLGYTLLLNVLPCWVDVSDPLHYEGIGDWNAGLLYSILQFAFVLGATISPPWVGKYADRHGKRHVLLGSLALVWASYFLQYCSVNIWQICIARFLCGLFSGALRPVSITYVAQMTRCDIRRCRLLGSLTSITAVSVGIGPALGAHLSTTERVYPFVFMMCLVGLCLVVGLLYLNDIAAHDDLVSSHSLESSIGIRSKRYGYAYKLILCVGFISYFMAMMASLSFPLSLKESFGLSPFTAGLCSLGDGPVMFFASMYFMYKLTDPCKAAKVSVICALCFGLVSLTPVAELNNSLPMFLALKYLTSLAGPIIFSTIPQILINISPKHVCGQLTGFVSCSQSSGRLLASFVAGPVFQQSSKFSYGIVGVTGASCAVILALLASDARRRYEMSTDSRQAPLVASNCVPRSVSLSVAVPSPYISCKE